MTDPSKKDSDSPAAPPTAPEGVKAEAPVPAAPPPTDPGLGSFRIGLRAAMRPPPSIPIPQAKAKPEQEAKAPLDTKDQGTAPDVTVEPGKAPSKDASHWDR